MDVLSTAGNKIVLWRDDVFVFTLHIITENADGAESVYAADVDGERKELYKSLIGFARNPLMFTKTLNTNK